MPLRKPSTSPMADADEEAEEGPPGADRHDAGRAIRPLTAHAPGAVATSKGAGSTREESQPMDERACQSTTRSAGTSQGSRDVGGPAVGASASRRSRLGPRQVRDATIRGHGLAEGARQGRGRWSPPSRCGLSEREDQFGEAVGFFQMG